MLTLALTLTVSVPLGHGDADDRVLGLRRRTFAVRFVGSAGVRHCHQIPLQLNGCSAMALMDFVLGMFRTNI